MGLKLRLRVTGKHLGKGKVKSKGSQYKGEGKGVRVRVRTGKSVRVSECIHVAVTKFVFAKAEKQRTFADPCKAKNRSRQDKTR